MSFILPGSRTAQRRQRHWTWLLLIPALSFCSGDQAPLAADGDSSASRYRPPTTAGTTPGTVSDLRVTATSGSSVTLAFTQVGDGTGSPAKYDVRYAPSPIAWGSATSTTQGTCTTPLAGTATSGTLSCTVLGLSPSTKYDFELVSFRGTLNQNAVFGGLSNVATGTTATASTIASVTVSPASANVLAGATQAYAATARDASGAAVSCPAFAWKSANTAVATVASDGTATAVTAGSTTITATCSNVSGSATITVSAPAPTTIVVSPASASIVAGGTQQLSAVVKDQNGNVMTGQTVTWSSSNAAAAAVSTTGNVTGVAAGSATITATAGGKAGTSAITVTAAQTGTGTLFFEEKFDDANLASRGWYDATSPAISTTEHAPGSTASAYLHWTVGSQIPVSAGVLRHKFPASSSFYVSFDVKYSANWIGSKQTYQPHEFHAMSTLDGDWEGPSDAYLTAYIEHNYQNGGIPKMGIQDNRSINTSYGAAPHNLIGVTESRSVAGCNGVMEKNVGTECWATSNSTGYYNLKMVAGPMVFSPTPGTPGYKNDWNHVEAYFQLNSIVNGVGQADGVMQYWFNGQLIIDRHDIIFRTGAHPTLQFNKFLIAPYIGDGSPVDQAMWLDNLRVASARIP